jgi:cell wall assembly regulator SMI1
MAGKKKARATKPKTAKKAASKSVKRTTVAATPKAKASAFTKAVARFAEWLEENAPDIELAPGASEATLKAAEAAMKRPFPRQLREWLSLHDGGDEACGGFDFLSAKKIASTYGEFLEYAEDAPAPLWLRALSNRGKSKGWFPFVVTAGGDYYCVDVDPGPRGVAGQVFRWNHDDEHRPPFATSLEEMFTRIADALEEGRVTYDAEEKEFRYEGEPSNGFAEVFSSPISPLAPLDSTRATYERRWSNVMQVARVERGASGQQVADVLAWGRSLGAMSEETLDRNLDFAATSVFAGNAFSAMLRAGAAREVLAVAKALVAACERRQYGGPFAAQFVSQLFAATTFVDDQIRDEVLEWALPLRAEVPHADVYFNAACALAKSGRKDLALLNVRLARQYGIFASAFRQDADFASLREDPDFLRAIELKQDVTKPFLTLDPTARMNVSMARAHYSLGSSHAYVIDNDPWRGIPIFDETVPRPKGAVFRVRLHEDSTLRPVAPGWYLADKADIEK